MSSDAPPSLAASTAIVSGQKQNRSTEGTSTESTDTINGKRRQVERRRCCPCTRHRLCTLNTKNPCPCHQAGVKCTSCAGFSTKCENKLQLCLPADHPGGLHAHFRPASDNSVALTARSLRDVAPGPPPRGGPTGNPSSSGAASSGGEASRALVSINDALAGGARTEETPQQAGPSERTAPLH